VGQGDVEAAGHAAVPDRQDKPDKPDKPDMSAEELDVGWGERSREPDRLSEEDERLLRERPPHWE